MVKVNSEVTSFTVNVSHCRRRNNSYFSDRANKCPDPEPRTKWNC